MNALSFTRRLGQSLEQLIVFGPNATEAVECLFRLAPRIIQVLCPGILIVGAERRIIFGNDLPEPLGPARPIRAPASASIEMLSIARMMRISLL